MRLNIAVVVAQAGRPGAVAVVALKQAAQLAKRHAVTLFSDSLPSEPLKDVACERLRARSFSILRRFAHVPNELSLCLAARRGLARLNDERPIDLVLCHGHPVAALAASWLKRGTNAKVGLVMHGDVRYRPRGTYDWRLTALYRATTRPAYRAADLVVALSPAMVGRAVNGGANPNVVRLIPNGIDPADFGLEDDAPISLPAPFDAPGRPLRVLFVGRLAVEKGVDTLLSAVSLLTEERRGIRVTVAGDGPLRANLERMAARESLISCIEFAGSIPRNRLATLYRTADVVCVPSLDESLPTVVLEALSCGTPVVGSDVGGIPFLVRNGKDGLIVRPGDAPDLAAALRRIAGDPELLRNLREATRAAAPAFRERHSWENAGKRLSEAIAAAVGAEGSGR